MPFGDETYCSCLSVNSPECYKLEMYGAQHLCVFVQPWTQVPRENQNAASCCPLVSISDLRSEKNGADGPHHKGGMLSRLGKVRADRLGTLLQCLSRSPMQTLCQHAHDHSLKGECGFHRLVVRRPGNVARDYFT